MSSMSPLAGVSARPGGARARECARARAAGIVARRGVGRGDGAPVGCSVMLRQGSRGLSGVRAARARLWVAAASSGGGGGGRGVEQEQEPGSLQQGRLLQAASQQAEVAEVGPAYCYYSPRYWMPCNSINEGWYHLAHCSRLPNECQ